MPERIASRGPGSLYARAGLADYWIVNLVEHVLEVYRDPAADVGAPDGGRYASAVTLRAGDVVTPPRRPALPDPGGRPGPVDRLI